MSKAVPESVRKVLGDIDAPTLEALINALTPMIANKLRISVGKTISGRLEAKVRAKK